MKIVKYCNAEATGGAEVFGHIIQITPNFNIAPGTPEFMTHLLGPTSKRYSFWVIDTEQDFTHNNLGESQQIQAILSGFIMFCLAIAMGRRFSADDNKTYG